MSQYFLVGAISIDPKNNYSGKIPGTICINDYSSIQFTLTTLQTSVYLFCFRHLDIMVSLSWTVDIKDGSPLHIPWIKGKLSGQKR